MPTTLKEFENNRKRNIQKIIRFSEEEWTIIEKRISKSGINSFNEFMVQMGMNGFILIEDYEYLIEVSKEINYIGRNINQIAYKTNINNSTNENDLKLILKYLTEIKVIISKSFKKKE